MDKIVFLLCIYPIFMCLRSLITGNEMTPGNQPIHEPRTAKMSAGQSPQDMIAHLKERLSAMKVKMVGFTYC